MLTGKLNRLLLDAIEESHRLHLSQAVQILINALYLEDSVALLEKRLSEMRCDTANAQTLAPADRPLTKDKFLLLCTFIFSQIGAQGRAQPATGRGCLPDIGDEGKGRGAPPDQPQDR